MSTVTSPRSRRRHDRCPARKCRGGSRHGSRSRPREGRGFRGPRAGRGHRGPRAETRSRCSCPAPCAGSYYPASALRPRPGCARPCDGRRGTPPGAAQRDQPRRRHDSGLRKASAHGERLWRARFITSSGPARTDPMGAPRPLDRVSVTVVAQAARSAGGTSRAAAAFMSRAPSRWTGTPIRAKRTAASGVITWPSRIRCVFSRASATTWSRADQRCSANRSSSESSTGSRSRCGRESSNRLMWDSGPRR